MSRWMLSWSQEKRSSSKFHPIRVGKPLSAHIDQHMWHHSALLSRVSSPKQIAASTYLRSSEEMYADSKKEIGACH